MAIMNTVKTVAKRLVGKAKGIDVYDMSSKEARQMQVKRDYEDAKTQKNPQTVKMTELENYYNNKPYTAKQAQALQEKLGLSKPPPVLTDPFIQVESQIDTTVPTFQFTGREDQDAKKARERERVVDYVLYNNGIDELNIDNERSLNTLGNAFFKVSWDNSIRGHGYIGDIVIGNPDPANIFPDPNAYDIDDCEYIIYAFRAHRRKLRRMFGKIIDTITTDGERSDTEIYETAPAAAPVNDETILVLEYWYRDDEGDIACSIQVNYVEVKHIPKYWVNTRHSGNQMYPIVKYGKIPMRKSFWDKGEIETCMELFDAANREFITAILNDAFMANDITVYEQDALPEGEEFSNVPGAKLKVKPNKINSVRRLGGVSANGGILEMIQFINEKIQETNGNYDSAQGKEPIRVTTASGIAQLNEKAESRKISKKAGRTEGYKRLAQLIDWTALEFYNQDRLISIGAKGEEDSQAMQQRETFVFNSDNHAMMGANGKPYYPKCDVEIVAGDGIRKSKAFTLQATQELAQTPVTPENIGIILSQVDMLDLPNKDIIKRTMEMAVAQQIQQRQAAMQPHQTPPKSPSESISFKDLPPSGKIQLAQQAGIQLTPEDFAQQIDAQGQAMEMTKLEMNHRQMQDQQAFELQKMQQEHRNNMELELAKMAASLAMKGGGNGEAKKADNESA